jgi:7-carboxy-7-deazaguanine synthase
MAPADLLLPVAEIFGPTFQGEGRSAGQLASFVRLGGCNLTCNRCDTKYTWDASQYDLRRELTNMTAARIMEALPVAPLTVLTGGEPLLYRDRSAFDNLIAALTSVGRVEIETNGTLPPTPFLLRHKAVGFNVSPKLSGPMSLDPQARRLVPDVLRQWAALTRSRMGEPRTIFKIVVGGVADVTTAVDLADEYGVPRRALWLMPEGTRPDTTLTTAQQVADAVLAAGANLTLRQHVLLWPGAERGR